MSTDFCQDNGRLNTAKTMVYSTPPGQWYTQHRQDNGILNTHTSHYTGPQFFISAKGLDTKPTTLRPRSQEGEAEEVTATTGTKHIFLLKMCQDIFQMSIIFRANRTDCWNIDLLELPWSPYNQVTYPVHLNSGTLALTLLELLWPLTHTGGVITTRRRSLTVLL